MANLSIFHAKSDTIADWSGTVTVGNSTGGTNTVQASDLVRPSDWNSAHNASLTIFASDITSLINVSGLLEISTSTNGITIQNEHVEFYEPFAAYATATTTFTPVNGSIYVDPVFFPVGMDSGHANFLAVNPAAVFAGATTFSTAATSTGAKTETLYHRFAVYTQDTANNTKLSQVWSTQVQYEARETYAVSATTSNALSIFHSASISLPTAIDQSGGITYGTFSGTSSSSTTASTAASSAANLSTAIGNYLAGSYVLPMPLATSMGAGNYFLAYQMSTATATAGQQYTQGTILSNNQGIAALNVINAQAFRGVGQSTTNSSTSPIAFDGYFSTTSTGFPSTIGTDGMRFSTQNYRLFWNYNELV